VDDIKNAPSVRDSVLRDTDEPVERLGRRPKPQGEQPEVNQVVEVAPAPSSLATVSDRQTFEEFSAHLMQERRTGARMEGRLLEQFARCEWRLMELQCWQEQIVRSLAPRTLEKLLEDYVQEPTERKELARRWALAEPDAVHRVRQLFTAAGLVTDVINARTFFDRMDDFLKLGRLITQAEKAKMEAFKAWNSFCDRVQREHRDNQRESREVWKEAKEEARKDREVLMRGTHRKAWP
jgi:hypothetical protein